MVSCVVGGLSRSIVGDAMLSYRHMMNLNPLKLLQLLAVRPFNSSRVLLLIVEACWISKILALKTVDVDHQFRRQEKVLYTVTIMITS